MAGLAAALPVSRQLVALAGLVWPEHLGLQVLLVRPAGLEEVVRRVGFEEERPLEQWERRAERQPPEWRKQQEGLVVLEEEVPPEQRELRKLPQAGFLQPR